MRHAGASPHWVRPTPAEEARRTRWIRATWLALAALLTIAGCITLAVFSPAEPEPLPVLAAPDASGSVNGRITYPPGRYPRLTWPNGEHRTVRSLLDIGQPMAFGEFVWNDAGVPPGPVWIRVDLGLQTLSVFRAGHEIGAAVILYGADGKPTPPGVYPILERAERHRSTLYDAPMPYMLRLTGDGVAIHASTVRAASATHGCIGVPLAFARHLFGEARRGDPVVVITPRPTEQRSRGRLKHDQP